MKQYFSAISGPALLTLCCVVTLGLYSACSAKHSYAAEEKKGAKYEEVVFQGKLTVSLKRHIPIPYLGIITEVHANPGEKVKKGDVLVKYKLDPKVIADLRRSISPPAMRDLEVRMAQISNELAGLRIKYREVQQLAQQKMASTQSQASLSQSMEALERQLQALHKQQDVYKQSAHDDIVALKAKLGEDISFDRIPDEVKLRSPIDGHVLWINSDLRIDAQMEPGPGVVVGVMDPMVIKASIFEIEASRIQSGDKAEVAVSSIPDKIFEASVTRINWATPNTNLGQPSYYEIELVAPNPNFTLKDGYKAQVTMKRK
jgi:multidrug resistance efflux pump